MSTAVFTRRAPDVRTLILLRHAKSDYPPGVADHDRPLAPRGRRDAPRAGEWIAQHCPVPDLVLVSSARRAQETWALASQSFPASTRVEEERRIYEAPLDVLERLVVGLDENLSTVVMVGHNPGLENLATALATDGDPDALGRMAMKYPTSGIAVLEGHGAWADMLRQSRLAHFAVGRG